MLPARTRMRARAEFAATVRRGRRGSSRALTVHVVSNPDPGSEPTPRVGFVVSAAVGPAVVRNRVRRRLRHLVRARLERLPGGAAVVIRAQPSAAALSSAELETELDTSLTRALTRGPA